MIWLENEVKIYRLAQSAMPWLAGRRHGEFWHPPGHEYVTAWPIRMQWSLWWMKGPLAPPSTPADLAAALDRQPPKDPSSWAVASLIDPLAQIVRKQGGPRVDASGPILPGGTRILAGRSVSDFCDGFDRQLATIASGPWAGTLVDLLIGRAGEPYLIARLGITPKDERIANDPDAAAVLLDRLRDVERGNPSL